MKKRFLLLLFLIISLPISSAKEITLTEIINYKVENIIVEEGILKLLINNPSDKYLQFYIIVNSEEIIITKEIIKPLTSNFISIPSKSSFIKEITITPGFQSQDKQDLYLYKSTTRTIEINQEVTPIEPEQEQTNLQVINSDSNKVYVYGNGLIASNNNNELTYYVNDVLGSNVIETNSQGDKINEITYDVYGQVLEGNANDMVSFTGKELDSSGLQYFGARYYDSSTGRFTQTDPILRDSVSNYHYANNNPLKFVDKDGNTPVAALAIPVAEQVYLWGIMAIGFIMANKEATQPIPGFTNEQIDTNIPGFVGQEVNSRLPGFVGEQVNTQTPGYVVPGIDINIPGFTETPADAIPNTYEVTLYHGSNVPNIKTLNPQKSRQPGGKYVYLTADREVAIEYALKRTFEKGGTPTLYTVKLSSRQLKEMYEDVEEEAYASKKPIAIQNKIILYSPDEVRELKEKWELEEGDLREPEDF